MKLIDLLEKYNFRRIVERNTEENSYDTKIIRIYYNACRTLHRWFEFGIYDFYEYAIEEYEKIINEQILNSEVDSFCYDENIGIFCIYLRGEE